MTKAKPSSVVIRSEKGMNIVHLMKLMEKKDLWEKKQLIILMGLHCDFTRLRSTWAGPVMRSQRLAQSEDRIERLGKKYLSLLHTIYNSNPTAQVVTTVPYIPDVRRYAYHRLRGRSLREAGLTSLQLREDEHFFREDMAAFIVWWENNVGWPLLELENLREEGQKRNGVFLTIDGVHPSLFTRDQFWRRAQKWILQGENNSQNINTPLPGSSGMNMSQVREDEEEIIEVEYGEEEPLPQRQKKRRERRAWENEIEDEEEATLETLMEDELRKRKEKEIEETTEIILKKKRAAIEQIEEEAKLEKRRKIDEIEQKYKEKVKNMKKILK